jgi:hypothetical protein
MESSFEFSFFCFSFEVDFARGEVRDGCILGLNGGGVESYVRRPIKDMRFTSAVPLEFECESFKRRFESANADRIQSQATNPIA